MSVISVTNRCSLKYLYWICCWEKIDCVASQYKQTTGKWSYLTDSKEDGLEAKHFHGLLQIEINVLQTGTSSTGQYEQSIESDKGRLFVKRKVLAIVYCY